MDYLQKKPFMKDPTADYLFKNWAGVYVKDAEGNTALHSAANNNYVEAVSLLLDKEIYINARNYNGKVPLHNAACYRNTKVASIL